MQLIPPVSMILPTKSYLQVWDESMAGNPDSFVDAPKAGIQLVLNDPKLLYFDTNWWEEAFQGIVALKLQGIAFNHYHISFTSTCYITSPNN